MYGQIEERIKFTDKLNGVLTDYRKHTTSTDDPLTARGIPKQDFFYWLIARICKLEKDIIALKTERKFNRDLIKVLGGKKKASEKQFKSPIQFEHSD